MKFSTTDWIALWHIFRPLIFEIYIALIVPTMLLCSRRLVSKRSTLAGIVLSAASFVSVMWVPVGAILWLVIGGVTFGERGRYSVLNGIPFAALMALGGTCAGALIIRFIFREPVAKKEFALLYAGNLLATALTITVLFIVISIHPSQVIA